MAQLATELRTLWNGFVTQRRVVGALFMREVLQRWGRRGLGFAWLFAEPLTFAIPVLTVWSYIREPYIHGIALVPFLYSSYAPLLVFRHVTNGAIRLISSNGALLYHKSITPFDIFVGRMGLEVLGVFGANIFLYIFFFSLGELNAPYDFSMIVLGFLYTAWWSFAAGLVVAPLSERWEVVERIWAPFTYLYVFFSGCFAMLAWLPPGLRTVVLLVDPPWHCYEMVRQGIFGNLARTYYDIPYLSFVLAALTLIGLWLMRHIRNHLEYR